MTYALNHLTTFKTQANCDELIELTSTGQLEELSEHLQGKDFIILGSGSNVLFADNYPGCVIVNRLQGIHILSENEQSATISIAAGENWHDVVVSLSQQGFYGLENLALIPGTVGAAPVQNIGAYGVEIADFIESVEVYDLQERKTKTFSQKACQFAYRNSLFKTPEARKKYLILTVILKLKKHFSPVLSYRGISEGEPPKTADELLQKVIDVRQSKLPDPEELPNAGSFFKNPIIAKKQLKILQTTFSDIPYFEIDKEKVKIPAAWLIEQSGFKGIHRANGAGVYDKHALILVNHGQAHGRDIYALACDIIGAVKQKFLIEIEPEVRIIPMIQGEKS